MSNSTFSRTRNELPLYAALATDVRYFELVEEQSDEISMRLICF